MFEEDHLKYKLANLPISNDTLVAIAAKAFLASDNFPCTTDEWVDLNMTNNTWSHWKDNYPKAHIKLSLRSKLSGDGNRLGSANISHQDYPLPLPDRAPPPNFHSSLN